MHTYHNFLIAFAHVVFGDLTVVHACGACSIGKLKIICRFLATPQKHRLFQTAPARAVTVAVVLTNAHTCLYGCQTAQ